MLTQQFRSSYDLHSTVDMDSSSTSRVASNSKQRYGSSHRTPASSVLWAHLLRKDTLAAPPSSDIPLPPIAPTDRTGTSLRILLHDTQAHVERFSERVEKLTKGVDEAKQELGLTKTLFQREHEELTNEMYNLGECLCTSTYLLFTYVFRQSTDARPRFRKRLGVRHRLKEWRSFARVCS